MAKYSGHDVERCPLLAASILAGLAGLGRRLEASQKEGQAHVWSAVVSSLRADTNTLSA